MPAAPSPNGGRTSTPRDRIPRVVTRPRRLSPNSSPQPAPTMAAASSPWMPIQSPACPRHRGLVCANSTDHTKVGPEHTKVLAPGNTLATLAVRASQADEIHALPLSNELRDHLFELHCPTCSHPTFRKGSWVITVRNFKCDSCGAKVRIGYQEKVKIFERRLREAVSSSASQMQSANEPKPVWTVR